MASTTGLFDDLVRCETRLYNAANDRLRERHGIVTSQFEFLRHVRDHPGCRVADVAATFAIGIGATSKGVDRLEARGWIVRQPNPADRRSSLLEVTADGRELVTAAEATVDGLLGELLGANLAASAIAAVADAMAGLRAALERDQIGLPTG
ncbi:MarR family winged helix-turn-helix transcriptional regulator [Actinoplanes sp. HUAS TT8]|uniref:MarR family winged helix-turn-helix transcriptional regulator n=1 Tax=Actinoplanes sp. HUAS TT8 TaxID=3447453 RepID=UPI003F5206AC